MKILFAFLILGVFLAPTVSALPECATVYNCLAFIMGVTDTPTTISSLTPTDFETALEGLTSIDMANFFASTATYCPFPSCPEGFVVNPSSVTQCKKTVASLIAPASPPQPAYLSLPGCLNDAAAGRGVFHTLTTGSTSFRIRNCMQPFNRAFKDCLSPRLFE